MSRAGVLVLAGIVGVAASGCAPSDGGPVPSASPLGSGHASTPAFGWELTEDAVGLRSLGLECEDLREYLGPSEVPAGTTIRKRRIAKPLDISAGSITIERSCIQPTTAGRGIPIISSTSLATREAASGPVLIRDSDFDGSLLDAELAAMSPAFSGIGDLRNNYIHHFGTGIVLMDTGQELDALIEHNYVTDLVAWGDGAKDGNHSDGLTVRDFDTSQRETRQVVVRNNRIDCESGNDTGAVFIQTFAGPINNVVLEGNLLEGGGYQLGLNETNHPYGGLTAVNNRFSGTGYGPAYVQGGPGWDHWEDNFLFLPGAADGRGTPIGAP